MDSRVYWSLATLSGGVGAGLIVVHFDPAEPLFYIGLTLMLTAAIVVNTGHVVIRARSLDAEFDAGYRVGYRAGRRVPLTKVLTPIRHHIAGESRHGGISQAPVGAVAGHGPGSRWAPEDPD
jgi:hypothetical protein